MLSALLSLAVALAPGPVRVGPAQAGEPAPTGPVAPREPRVWRGTGALVVGALAGAAGLGLGLGTARRFAALERCPACDSGANALPLATIVLNTAGFTLIAAGAGLRGLDEGGRFARTGAPRRQAGATIGLGALVLGGGGLLVAGALAWRLIDASSSSGTPWAILQGGMSMIVAGSGLVVFGTTYRRAAGEGPQVRLAPQVGRLGAGLALVGAF